MRKLILAVLSITIVLAALSIVMMLIGRSDTTQPELFQHLRICDGQPCYLGIAPGKTTWNDAVAIFENRHIGFDPDINIASNPLGFRGSAILLASRDYDTVTQIELSIRSPEVSIGSLILQMGSPCGVIYTLDGIFALFYPGMSVQVDVDNPQQPIKATSLPVIITLFSNYKSCDQYDQLPSNYGVQPWRGFAHYTN